MPHGGDKRAGQVPHGGDKRAGQMPHSGDKRAGQMPHGAVKNDVDFFVSGFTLIKYLLMKAYSRYTKSQMTNIWFYEQLITELIWPP